MITNLLNDLKQKIDGDIYFDPFSLKAYSIDASIYQIEPMGIILPKSKDDVLLAVTEAKNNKIPIIPRGAGTGITGGCIGKALIMDFSKYMNRILDINYTQEYAVCQPGVIQDQLNNELEKEGYRLGPDTSTGNRATIGGMLGNNSSGAHSMHFGKMVDNILAAELILANGETLKCNSVAVTQLLELSTGSTTKTRIYQFIQKIRENLTDEINLRYPKIQKRVSGYNLDELIKSNTINLAKLIAGSEGTLGITTEIKLKICKNPAQTALCLLLFDDLVKGLNSVELLLKSNPYSLELIDDKIINSGRISPVLKGKLNWLSGDPQALLVVEFKGDSNDELDDKLTKFETEIRSNMICSNTIRITEQDCMNNVWKLRKAGLGLLMAKRTNERAIAFLEDIAVPPGRIGNFISKFKSYLSHYSKEAGIYGHAGEGCIHLRPMMDLRKPQEVELMLKMMEDVSDIVSEFGGTLSGEHGDGIIRSWLLEKMFGTSIYEAFNELKQIFDPENLMNPGKIVNPADPGKNLRIGIERNLFDLQTFLDFKKEGGFSFAVEMCNGNGECRKTDSGIMCPSFQITHDERETTRARAIGLKSIMNGDFSSDELFEKGLYNILDLCIQCKGCKKECPSQVDMAKMKSEFLYHYHTKNGFPLRSRIFGAIDKINKFGSFTAPITNWFIKTGLNKYIFKSLQIHSERQIPSFARKRFSQWYHNNNFNKHIERKDNCIVLFIDTFTEYNNPEIGKAAITILKLLNFDVIIPEIHCCGRPLISKGLLDHARVKAAKLVDQLSTYAEFGYPIVGLEPSCILTIKDEFPALLHGRNIETVEKIADLCCTIDYFLNKLLIKNKFHLPFRHEHAKILVHSHCHQKSLEDVTSTLNVLKKLPGSVVSEINSGCCGMAGSFGYETEHFDVSNKIAESRLFPAIRSANDNVLIAANGFSCRQQIIQGTNRSARHPLEILESRLL